MASRPAGWGRRAAGVRRDARGSGLWRNPMSIKGPLRRRGGCALPIAYSAHHGLKGFLEHYRRLQHR